MKKIYLILPILLLFISACKKTENNDDGPNNKLLDNILRVEAFLFIENDTVEFVYTDGKIIKSLSSHYIWFNTIEGSDNINEDVFRSDFNTNVLGKNITGFLEMKIEEDDNSNRTIHLEAHRISQNSNSKKTYDMVTQNIRQYSDEMVDGRREVSFISSGFAVCDTTLISTSYEYVTTSYTETMIAYACNAQAEIKIIIYYNK